MVKFSHLQDHSSTEERRNSTFTGHIHSKYPLLPYWTRLVPAPIQEFEKLSLSKAAFAKTHIIPQTSLNDIIKITISKFCENKKGNDNKHLLQKKEIDKALMI